MGHALAGAEVALRPIECMSRKNYNIIDNRKMTNAAMRAGADFYIAVSERGSAIKGKQPFDARRLPGTWAQPYRDLAVSSLKGDVDALIRALIAYQNQSKITK